MKTNGKLGALIRAIHRADLAEKRADKIGHAARVRRQQAHCAYMLAAAPAIVEKLAGLEWRVYDGERYYVHADIQADSQLARYLGPRLRWGTFRIALHVDLQTHDHGATIKLLLPREAAIARKWWAPPKQIPWQTVKRLVNNGALDTAEGIERVKKLLAAGKERA